MIVLKVALFPITIMIPEVTRVYFSMECFVQTLNALVQGPVYVPVCYKWFVAQFLILGNIEKPLLDLAIFNFFQVAVLFGIEPKVQFEPSTRLPSVNKVANIALINILFAGVVLLIMHLDKLHF